MTANSTGQLVYSKGINFRYYMSSYCTRELIYQHIIYQSRYHCVCIFICVFLYVRMRACVYVRACVRACVCVCVRVFTCSVPRKFSSNKSAIQENMSLLKFFIFYFLFFIFFQGLASACRCLLCYTGVQCLIV